MADKELFTAPAGKSYSVKNLLNEESLQEALHAIRDIQTMLWETMPNGQYALIEKHFDVAIASMMAHLIGVPVENGNGAQKLQRPFEHDRSTKEGKE